MVDTQDVLSADDIANLHEVVDSQARLGNTMTLIPTDVMVRLLNAVPKRALLTPTIRSSNFGPWFDFGVGGSIVVGVHNYGIVPKRLLLSHQLYVHTARALLDEYPGRREIAVLHVESGGEWLMFDPREALREDQN